MGTRAVDIDKELELIVNKQKTNACSQDHEHSQECTSNRSSHLNDVTTICLVHNQPLDEKKLISWLGKLLWDEESRSADILRMKGVLSFGTEACRFAIQGVHDIFDLSRTEVPWGNSERISKLVFIGRNLDEEALQSGFVDCVFQEETKSNE